MDKEAKEKIKIALNQLCQDHDIKNASFCGSVNGGVFAYVSLNQTDNNVFESIMNVGRLWQYTRGVTRKMLDEFEGKW